MQPIYARACVLALLLAGACEDTAQRSTGLSDREPHILSNPSNVAARECGSAVFSVRASGAPPLTFQWFRNGLPISGAASAIYTLKRLGVGDNMSRFTVTVSNDLGVTASREAILTVEENAAPVTLSPGRALSIAVHGDDAVWTDGAGVYAARLDCTGEVRRLYEREGLAENTFAITTGGRNVFWSDQYGGAIRAVDMETGQTRTVIDQLGTGSPIAIAATSEAVYWPSATRGLLRLTDASRAVDTLAADPLNSGAIMADSAYVFWSDLGAGSLRRFNNLDGVVDSFPFPEGTIGDIALDSTHVYWAFNASNEGSTTGYVFGMNRGGFDVIPIAAGPPVRRLAVAEGEVYWTTGEIGSSDGAVLRAPLDGTYPPDVVVSALDSPHDISVTDRYLVWLDRMGVHRMKRY